MSENDPDFKLIGVTIWGKGVPGSPRDEYHQFFFCKRNSIFFSTLFWNLILLNYHRPLQPTACVQVSPILSLVLRHWHLTLYVCEFGECALLGVRSFVSCLSCAYTCCLLGTRDAARYKVRRHVRERRTNDEQGRSPSVSSFPSIPSPHVVVGRVLHRAPLPTRTIFHSFTQ